MLLSMVLMTHAVFMQAELHRHIHPLPSYDLLNTKTRAPWGSNGFLHSAARRTAEESQHASVALMWAALFFAVWQIVNIAKRERPSDWGRLPSPSLSAADVFEQYTVPLMAMLVEVWLYTRYALHHPFASGQWHGQLMGVLNHPFSPGRWPDQVQAIANERPAAVAGVMVLVAFLLLATLAWRLTRNTAIVQTNPTVFDVLGTIMGGKQGNADSRAVLWNLSSWCGSLALAIMTLVLATSSSVLFAPQLKPLHSRDTSIFIPPIYPPTTVRKPDKEPEPLECDLQSQVLKGAMKRRQEDHEIACRKGFNVCADYNETCGECDRLCEQRMSRLFKPLCRRERCDNPFAEETKRSPIAFDRRTGLCSSHLEPLLGKGLVPLDACGNIECLALFTWQLIRAYSQGGGVDAAVVMLREHKSALLRVPLEEGVKILNSGRPLPFDGDELTIHEIDASMQHLKRWHEEQLINNARDYVSLGHSSLIPAPDSTPENELWKRSSAMPCVRKQWLDPTLTDGPNACLAKLKPEQPKWTLLHQSKWRVDEAPTLAMAWAGWRSPHMLLKSEHLKPNLGDDGDCRWTKMQWEHVCGMACIGSGEERARKPKKCVAKRLTDSLGDVAQDLTAEDPQESNEDCQEAPPTPPQKFGSIVGGHVDKPPREESPRRVATCALVASVLLVVIDILFVTLTWFPVMFGFVVVGLLLFCCVAGPALAKPLAKIEGHPCLGLQGCADEPPGGPKLQGASLPLQAPLQEEMDWSDEVWLREAVTGFTWNGFPLDPQRRPCHPLYKGHLKEAEDYKSLCCTPFKHKYSLALMPVNRIYMMMFKKSCPEYIDDPPVTEYDGADLASMADASKTMGGKDSSKGVKAPAPPKASTPPKASAPA